MDAQLTQLQTLEQAKELLLQYDMDVNNLKKSVPSEVFTQYQSLTSEHHVLMEWTCEYCRPLLQTLIDGAVDNYVVILSKVAELTYEFGGQDILLDLFSAAWFKVLESAEPPLRIGSVTRFLNTCLSRMEPSVKPEKLLTLMEKTEAAFLSDDKNDAHSSLYRHFCECSEKIRRIQPDAPTPFAFVKTEPHLLEIIRERLLEKLGSTDAVKQYTAELNCAYGVQNNILFLTANSNAAFGNYIRSPENVRFLAVFPKSETVEAFSCSVRSNGTLEPQNTEVPSEMISLLTDAIAVFRSIPARSAFFQAQGDTKQWIAEIEACDRAFQSQFPPLLRDIYAQIPDCSIRPELTRLVDAAEKQALHYGMQHAIFQAPASELQLASWELKFCTQLPAEYQELLCFANGVEMPSGTTFYALKDIRQTDDVREHSENTNGYLCLGYVRAEDDVLLLRKSDGVFAEYYQGRIYEHGSFARMMKNTLDREWNDF